MRVFLLLFFLLTLFLQYSCKKYKPADPAFFLTANEISVAATASQGSGSHKISDFFLYVNNQFQGVYPVGNRMPIVSKGERVVIDVLPGIKNNGISKTRLPWIFYNSIHFDTLIENGQNINRDFTFSYNSAVTFTWTEGFNASLGLSLKKSAISDTTFKLAAATDSFEGGSMELGLSDGDLVAQVESSSAYTLPKATPNVYLEINYKCNNEFSMGLIGDNGQLKPVFLVNPQESWNKIYIQLAEVLNTTPVSDTYKIYFRMLKTDDGAANPKMFLDNIKLIYIK